MSSSNNRIFYACQAVALTVEGDTSIVSGDMIHGLQSVGMTTNFNLEQAFELGQVEIYENIEGTPDIEVTLEKVLDGYPLIYHMASSGATAGGGNSNPSSGLVGRTKDRCDLRLGIFDESKNNVDTATQNNGDSEVEIYCSGMYISSLSYTIPVDGNATESVTLVGNNKVWLQGAATEIINAAVTDFDGNDSPLGMGVSGAASGGIVRREDVILSGCILPKSIKGVIGSGYGNGIFSTSFDPSTVTNRVHLQSFSVSTDLSREDVLELGRKTPYYRPANFPVEVSCEIEAITTSGDFVFGYEFGDSNLNLTIDSGNNTSNEMIYIWTRQGYGFDLGGKNRLASVSYGGGDAGGGNVSCTYSYTNFNDLDVQDAKTGRYYGWGALKNGHDGDGKANNIGQGTWPGHIGPNL